MRVSGQQGELRVGYQQAARLGDWEIVALPRSFRFTAHVEAEHSYWMSQRPLDLALAVGRTEWLWRGVAVERAEEGAVVVDLAARPEVVPRVAAATDRGGA